jgi:flagellar basal body rod protein FlgG
MSVGLYRAAVAMVGDQRRLDAIASNLANLGTVGFKRTTTATHEFLLGDGGPRGQALQSRVDFSQGNLNRTGRQYDLALFGKGFFAVEGPDGEVYTRDGSFHSTSDGVLVTEEGLPVAWNRRGSAIDPTGLPITVDGDGFVRQGTATLGQLRIVDFQDERSVVLGRGGYWVARPAAKEATALATVHQYALEESNATGVEEMVAMIGVQRSFESMANMVQSIQQSYSRLTRPF